MKILIILIFIISSVSSGVLDKKGKIQISWGWNKSIYTQSDIHFTGANYDYTLYGVKASDRQTPFGWIYLREQTIPQYNLRIEYFIDDHQAISFNVDHMKYVMDRPQVANIDGLDHLGKQHTNDNIELLGFLALEHTDGLNYINVAYNYFYPLWEDNTHQHAISIFAGGGVGILVPRSNITLEGYEDTKDEFKLVGYGLDLQSGLQIDLYNDFFIRGEVKGGYINMPNISTSIQSQDKASQSFGFFEYSIAFGYRF